MKYYTGLDVSLKTTFISIIDESGKIIQEAVVVTEVDQIAQYLQKQGIEYEEIGIESGQLSIPLCKGLRKKGMPVICVDARHMAAALSARINKNDQNDARGIAQMMRAGLYKTVQIKSDESCQIKVLLGSRRQLINMRKQAVGTIRGLLKIYDIKLGSKTTITEFSKKVRERISNLSDLDQTSISVLLSSLEAVALSLNKTDKTLEEISQNDMDCKLLMTVPGVGAVTAMTYKAAIDDPSRFEKSEVVGAYVGLTPKQYASGEIDRHGGISKMGPKECRTMLYEAAMSLLVHTKNKIKLKTWGLKLAKKKGLKRAVVAVARKLATIMHRMLIEKREFCDQ